jgi:uncharacterized OB-fold protein
VERAFSSAERQGDVVFPPGAEWAEGDDGIHLIGSLCSHCDGRAFPGLRRCHACGSDQHLQPHAFSSTGRLYAYSEIHALPIGFQSSYVIGYVDLDDGIRVLGQVDNPGAELRIGDAMQTVLGVIRVEPAGARVISYRFRRQP